MGRYYNGDISLLAGHIPEPIRQNEVLAAARTLTQPFILREVVAATGLPTHIVHRVLSRLVKRGTLTRFKIKSPYPQFTGCYPAHRKWIPGGRIRNVYAYRFADPTA